VQIGHSIWCFSWKR